MAHNQDYTDYIQSEAWAAVRQEAFRIHGRKCARCLGTNQLHVHHKTYKNFKNEDVQNDLVPLCRLCHKKLHKFCKKRQLDLFHGSEIFIANEPNIYVQKIGKKEEKRRRRKLQKIYDRETLQSRRVPRRSGLHVVKSPAAIPVKKTITIDLLKFMTMYKLPESEARSILGL